MKHKRLVNAVKCDETVQRRQASKTMGASSWNQKTGHPIKFDVNQVRQAKRVKKSLSKLEKAGIKYNFQIAEMAADVK